MITRKQYISGEVSHREYYGQFVGSSVRAWVAAHVGIKRLRKSTDEHLNDIHLSIWDSYYQCFMIDGTARKVAEANGNGGVSLSDAVCVAKEAARQLLEQAEEGEA